MSRSKVWIINQGDYKGMSAEAGDYDEWAGIIQRGLTRKEDITVQTVPKYENILPEAAEAAKDAVLVFLTGGMFGAAVLIKKSFPDLRVVLCTGEPPPPDEKEGLVVFDKKNFPAHDKIPEAILGE